MKDLYPLGETPPTGRVPERMIAATIRRERFGEPKDAMIVEEVPTPPVGPGQVLVWVMAAGVNYNMVWASLGRPVDVIAMNRRAGSTEDLHVGGSDGAGIVWAVGSRVRGTKVGDEVILTVSQWDERSDDVRLGTDGTCSRSTRVWGYETSHGSLAQFAVVDDYQVHPKPAALSWEDAGCFSLTAGTAYRQLCGWHPHTVSPGDPVLIWGGAGGLGSMAIQIVNQLGGVPVAVVSDGKKAEHCRSAGAHATIDRQVFQHWGPMPPGDTPKDLRQWQVGVRRFQQAFWEVLGERRSPRIVLEHPGSATLPTSIAVCDLGGMVVTCGATSGYHADLDLRFLWMRQIRLQGSHMANTRQFRSVIALAGRGSLDVCRTGTYSLAESSTAHQLLREGAQMGNLAIRVNAPAA
ncbi:crotonyl-CoA carboxylase/reductase [Streptomyces boncukensis]|uniref:Crotonyl-CoA carboxylase/reductase n=1 Tax=Streptomyces boncukensis TaxID=2711219 RepID=A0A6G4X2K7_9ACTN|nr:crotonyl-CoA carboxylase/reductase [Streptomyces boncukensis]NGO71776.1 crotonyl-CoA carboxylase/reductase [Streptomyces boncukensis]